MAIRSSHHLLGPGREEDHALGVELEALAREVIVTTHDVGGAGEIRMRRRAGHVSVQREFDVQPATPQVHPTRRLQRHVQRPAVAAPRLQLQPIDHLDRSVPFDHIHRNHAGWRRQFGRDIGASDGQSAGQPHLTVGRAVDSRLAVSQTRSPGRCHQPETLQTSF